MNKQYECGIILDLLPMFIEDMVSKQTEQVIQQHLSECEECRKTYEEMNIELDISIDKKKNKPSKKHKYRKKSRVRFFIYAYLLLLLSVVAFCLIDIIFFQIERRGDLLEKKYGLQSGKGLVGFINGRTDGRGIGKVLANAFEGL